MVKVILPWYTALTISEAAVTFVGRAGISLARHDECCANWKFHVITLFWSVVVDGAASRPEGGKLLGSLVTTCHTTVNGSDCCWVGCCL